ncbi:NMCC_0638 family (lipo)protein [Pseudomonas petrae]|uniref:Lipoprotein n=1 Tax=Pseudomonas petrae TaxID=2912190 RepID=A0ABS9I5D5_9PSED|nr:hypothetical protein [Pseudomonas petrae]MCF7532277.1 hypothetical protein [Pseudomonas petrae]MCF7535908.1 hypothetical protein [Pseudomonas petrae]MCF7542770.1 hypothetical protein [Pseudomonas petrae]MCF7554972.1 hypothetical protein [Pseudomonas petrae]
MLKFLALFTAIGCMNTCIAAETDDPANSFAKIYGSLCLRNLPNLEALRVKLAPMPKLPPQKAALFLADAPGDAWPVPDEHGTFILALPAGKKLCAIYARRADANITTRLFKTLVANPPAPFHAELVRDDHEQTGANGMTHTLSYQWSVPNGTRKMLFTLTTAASDTANIQALGTAAVISQ